MIKIGNSASNISVYTCQPKDKDELKKIIKARIDKEGPNCDLNDIDVSLVEDMSWLFAYLRFNGDISRWNVSNVENMVSMFYNASFNGDISRWDVSNVKHMSGMFFVSNFNQDISNWEISKDCNTDYMFKNCAIKEEFKPKLSQ